MGLQPQDFRSRLPWLDASHQGNLSIDYVRGYEAILDALAAEFPDVTFQACSSGGGRADYGTMRRHHEFWTSDNTDACERVFMQWGIGHLFPAISMAAHVTASPIIRQGAPRRSNSGLTWPCRPVWDSSFSPAT